MSERPLKLYRVRATIEFDMPVIARDGEQAKGVAFKNWRHDLENVYAIDVEFDPKLVVGSMPDEFDDCVPWYDTGDPDTTAEESALVGERTCEQWLVKQTMERMPPRPHV